MRCFEVVLLADRGEKPNLWSLICNYWTDKPDCRCAMAEFLGLLAFASLIAAQFVAVVVAYAQRFENDLPGGQRSATGMKGDSHKELTTFHRYLLRGRQSSGRDSALHKLIVPPS
jgi:hypothetical protein